MHGQIGSGSGSASASAGGGAGAGGLGGRAMCAEHPDLPAAGGVCARCGTYMCGGCVSASRDQRMCIRCYTRVVGVGRAQHLPLLSVLSFVHGGMLIVAGGFYALTYAGLGSVMMFAPPPPQPIDGNAPPPPELFGGIMFGVAIVIGLAHVVPGVLQIVAGARMRKRRGRVFAIFALVSGLVTMLSCYCLPTSLALLIFGLVVLLDGSVREAMDREHGG